MKTNNNLKGENMKLTKSDIKVIKRIWFIRKQIDKLSERSQDIRLKFQDDKKIDGKDFNLIYGQLQRNKILK